MALHVKRSDEELARRAQAGCIDSFEILARRFQPRLLAFLRLRVRSTSDAEDLLQETLLRAYRKLDRFKPAMRFSTWLYTIAHRLTINQRRRDRRMEPIEDTPEAEAVGTSPLEQLTEQETHSRLWRIVRRELSDRQFTILWLHYVEGVALKDAGSAVGRSPGAARADLLRARRKLRPHLASAGITTKVSVGHPEQIRGCKRAGYAEHAASALAIATEQHHPWTER